jgi:hypothetical protein
MAHSEEATQEVKRALGDFSQKDSKGLNGWLSTFPQLSIFSWLYVIPLMCFLGICVALIYVTQLPSGVRWSAFATALVIGSSAFFMGGLVGFLFGVPRTVQGPAPSSDAIQYQGNTNLEQISDWLTKIIVGVGLVQVGRLIPALGKFAESMKAPLGGQASSGAFGLGVAITSTLLGFLYFYLWSRSLMAQGLEMYSTFPQQGTPEEQPKHADPSSVNNLLDS